MTDPASRSLRPWADSRALPWIDGLLVAAALVFAATTLAYPFGGDQGLYYYVGREWSRGAVPYRDAMEQKTPLIFLIHAGLVRLTGPNMWAIRAAEILWVVFLGVVVADLARPPAEPRRAGVLGFSVLSVAVAYFSLFNYWDTAQCEIWYSGLALLSLWAVTRQRGLAGWRMGGWCAGLAWLMKPPAAVLLLVVVWVLLWRARRDAVLSPQATAWGRSGGPALVVYGIWGLLPAAIAAGYFAAVSGLQDLLDQAFGANFHDMRHSATVSSLSETLARSADFVARATPLLPLAVVAALTAVALPRRRGQPPPQSAALALALLGSAWAAVALQRKFYGYHWGVLAPILALALAGRVHEAAGRWARRPWAVPLLSGALVVGCGLATEPGREYARTSLVTVRHLAGLATREELLARFVMDDNTPYAQHETVGRWLARHTGPHETVAVRGFDTPIYAVADRRAPTRFFWTRWLTEPRRAYHRERWLAQDRVALARQPPRFVVVNERARKGPASRHYFVRAGYVERWRHGRLIVLEAPAAPARSR